MLKKTVTYENFNGATVTEDLYFNLTKSELTNLQLSKEGGFDAYIQRIVDAKDTPELAKAFRDIILMSYGEKSADGKRFIKLASDGHKISDDFSQSAAFDALYMELITDDKAAAAFINGVVPQNVEKPNNDHPALKG